MSTKRLVFLQFIICVLLILGLEIVARVAITLSNTKFDEPGAYAFSTELGWDRKPNYSGPEECGAQRNFDASGLVATDAAKLRGHDKARPRVLFIGDSNTFGYCLETKSTFVEAAQRLLPDLLMINLGVSGYTSFQGYKTLLKYGEQLKPDLVVASFNFNDRRYVVGPSNVDSDAKLERLARAQRLNNLLEVSYLYRLVRAVGLRLGIVSSGKATRTSVDELYARVPPENYRANLIKIVEWSRQHHAPIVFLLLGDNPNVVSALHTGIERYESGDYEAAIRYLSYAESRPLSFISPVAKKYIAKTYAALGQPDKARQALAIKKPFLATHGGQLLYLDTDYNEIMRQVAREYGVSLIDAKRELDKAPRVFFDLAHFGGEGHQIVGELLQAELPQILARHGAASQDVSSRQQPDTSVHK